MTTNIMLALGRLEVDKETGEPAIILETVQEGCVLNIATNLNYRSEYYAY